MVDDSTTAIGTLYGDSRSGNCWKVLWTLVLTATPFRWQPVDILQGTTRKPEFLAMNRNGKVPTLRLSDGRCLAESNAICWYLAEGSALLPAARFARAEVMQWLCFEQYSHEPYVAVARFIRQFEPNPAAREDEFQARLPGAHKALAVMEQHLDERDWFVGDALTLADVALYAYTHVADEADIDLAPYVALQRWLDRCAAALPDIGRWQ